MTDIALGLDKLVPGAVYSGSLTANTEEAYNNIVWNDPRDKPVFADVVAAGVITLTSDDIRAEASRRMQLLVGARDEHHLDIIIANASREAIRLLRIGPQNWTAGEAQRAAELEAADLMIEAIRTVSNTLEPNPPLNYKDDSLWP